MTGLDELKLLLRPAGGGIYLVSSGRQAQLDFQARYYGVGSEDAVRARFIEGLDRVCDARVVVLAVPSDVGASFLRGSSVGPQAIRSRLLEEVPDWPDRARRHKIVDLGDVFVVPQLLHDSMLSDRQLAASRRALYPELAETAREALPVSPLSLEERVLELVLQLNPRVVPVLLGGDHSAALPLARALGARHPEPWAIVQVDAHTDLLPERLGVEICFATWSYHANELLGRQGRLVQVGTRASRHERGYWEQELGVRQFWAQECIDNADRALAAILGHLRGLGVRSVYLSNDIDGTDFAHADATGTPEPGGLAPEFVVELIRRVGAEFELLAADVMEVAPPLARTQDGARETVGHAVRYLRESLSAVLGEPL